MADYSNLLVGLLNNQVQQQQLRQQREQFEKEQERLYRRLDEVDKATVANQRINALANQEGIRSLSQYRRDQVPIQQQNANTAEFSAETDRLNVTGNNEYKTKALAEQSRQFDKNHVLNEINADANLKGKQAYLEQVRIQGLNSEQNRKTSQYQLDQIQKQDTRTENDPFIRGALPYLFNTTNGSRRNLDEIVSDPNALRALNGVFMNVRDKGERVFGDIPNRIKSVTPNQDGTYSLDVLNGDPIVLNADQLNGYMGTIYDRLTQRGIGGAFVQNLYGIDQSPKSPTKPQVQNNPAPIEVESNPLLQGIEAAWPKAPDLPPGVMSSKEIAEQQIPLPTKEEAISRVKQERTGSGLYSALDMQPHIRTGIQQDILEDRTDAVPAAKKQVAIEDRIKNIPLAPVDKNTERLAKSADSFIDKGKTPPKRVAEAKAIQMVASGQWDATQAINFTRFGSADISSNLQYASGQKSKTAQVKEELEIEEAKLKNAKTKQEIMEIQDLKVDKVALETAQMITTDFTELDPEEQQVVVAKTKGMLANTAAEMNRYGIPFDPTNSVDIGNYMQAMQISKKAVDAVNDRWFGPEIREMTPAIGYAAKLSGLMKPKDVENMLVQVSDMASEAEIPLSGVLFNYVRSLQKGEVRNLEEFKQLKGI